MESVFSRSPVHDLNNVIFIDKSNSNFFSRSDSLLSFTKHTDERQDGATVEFIGRGYYLIAGKLDSKYTFSLSIALDCQIAW